jgi:hypothetical protein
MYKLFILLIAMTLLGTMSVEGTTTTNNFTGGDAGEGLDLSGAYAYMVDIGGAAATRTIQGYTFTGAAGAGITVTLTGTAVNGNWETRPEYGSSSSDNDLESMMHNTVLPWSGTTKSIAVDATVSSGHDYELTLLFSNNAEGDRFLDVAVEETLISDEFNPFVNWGGNAAPPVGRALTHQFTAGDGTLNVLITPGSTWDPNPLLQGFILKDLGAPSMEVSTFTGGDAGEGLDLSGTMVYMVDVGSGTATRTIQGHTFTADDSTAGVTTTVTGNPITGNIGTQPVYGDTSSDDALELMMYNGQAAWDTGAGVHIDMAVEQGRNYTLGLLIAENFYNGSPARRYCDIAVEGYQMASDFDTLQGATWAGSPGSGVLMTVMLTAGDDTINVDVTQGTISDNNPLIQGFYLSVEPAGTVVSVQ